MVECRDGFVAGRPAHGHGLARVAKAPHAGGRTSRTTGQPRSFDRSPPRSATARTPIARHAAYN
jgi:hypothetical protein